MASKRAKRRKQCGTKVRHADEDSAHAAIRKMKKAGAFNLTAYHCQWCNGWHVGHTPYRIRQAIKARTQLNP